MNVGEPIDIEEIERQYAADKTPTVSVKPYQALIREITGPPEPTAPPTKWQDSRPIKALSKFLKRNPKIELFINETGKYSLHFSGGITPAMKTRWTQAEAAFDLLIAALDDLDHLKKIGKCPLLSIEKPKRKRSKRKKIGSSRKSF